jgi:Transposase DDE domain
MSWALGLDWPVRTIRSLSFAPESAARVLPVCRSRRNGRCPAGPLPSWPCATYARRRTAARRRRAPSVGNCFDSSAWTEWSSRWTHCTLHTQHDTATLVKPGPGGLRLTVKANQKSWYAQLNALPWTSIPAVTRTDRGHGRRATRTIKVVDVPAWIELAAAGQVAQLRRTVTRNGRRTIEIVYLITSADRRTAPPAVLAAWTQSHWEIENRLHRVRDVTFDEDRSQIRTGNAPRVMAGLRNTAITLLRLDGHQNIAAAPRSCPQRRPPHQPAPDSVINNFAGTLTWHRGSLLVSIPGFITRKSDTQKRRNQLVQIPGNIRHEAIVTQPPPINGRREGNLRPASEKKESSASCFFRMIDRNPYDHLSIFARIKLTDD